MSDQYTSQVDINNPQFNKEGKNEIMAIKDANQALQIARRLLRDDWRRDWRRSQCLGAYNGDAPYSDAELRSIGQSYRYNVSFGYMEGVIGRAVMPFNQLSGNLANIAALEADLPDEKTAILQDEFINQIKEWGKWQKFSSRLNLENVLYGWVTAIFPTTYDPWPIMIDQKNSFTNEGTPNDTSDLEVFVWRKQYLIHELYAKIIDPKKGEQAGWNVDNVRKALENAIPNDIWRRNSTDSGTWSAVEEAIRGGSLYNAIVGAKVIDVFHVFASEITGEVSHWVVLDKQAGENSDGDGPELFKKLKRFKSFREFIVYYDLEPGDGKWHGSRGLGQRAYNTHVAVDKVRNTILDQAFTSGLSILQASDQNSNEEFNLDVVGPFAVIPQGVTMQATQIPAIAATTFQADGLLVATGEQRIGDVVPSGAGAYTQGDKTATQANIDANRSMMIQKDNLQRYIDPLSQTLSIMLRRLANPNSENPYSKDFVKNVKAKGITDEELKKIKGMRSTGRIDDILGETQAKNQLLLNTFRGDTQVNQYELKRRVITAEVGAEEALKLLPPQEDEMQVLSAVQQQATELGAMINQVQVPASPQDNHPIHIQTIIKWLDGVLGAVASGQPTPSMQAVEIAVQHGEKHFEFMKADKEMAKQSKELMVPWKELLKGFKKVIEQNQKMMQAQGQVAEVVATQPPTTNEI